MRQISLCMMLSLFLSMNGLANPCTETNKTPTQLYECAFQNDRFGGQIFAQNVYHPTLYSHLQQWPAAWDTASLHTMLGKCINGAPDIMSLWMPLKMELPYLWHESNRFMTILAGMIRVSDLFLIHYLKTSSGAPVDIKRKVFDAYKGVIEGFNSESGSITPSTALKWLKVDEKFIRRFETWEQHLSRKDVKNNFSEQIKVLALMHRTEDLREQLFIYLNEMSKEVRTLYIEGMNNVSALKKAEARFGGYFEAVMKDVKRFPQILKAAVDAYHAALDVREQSDWSLHLVKDGKQLLLSSTDTYKSYELIKMDFTKPLTRVPRPVKTVEETKTFIAFTAHKPCSDLMVRGGVQNIDGGCHCRIQVPKSYFGTVVDDTQTALKWAITMKIKDKVRIDFSVDPEPKESKAVITLPDTLPNPKKEPIIVTVYGWGIGHVTEQLEISPKMLKWFMKQMSMVYTKAKPFMSPNVAPKTSIMLDEKKTWDPAQALFGNVGGIQNALGDAYHIEWHRGRTE